MSARYERTTVERPTALKKAQQAAKQRIAQLLSVTLLTGCVEPLLLKKDLGAESGDKFDAAVERGLHTGIAEGLAFDVAFNRAQTLHSRSQSYQQALQREENLPLYRVDIRTTIEAKRHNFEQRLEQLIAMNITVQPEYNRAASLAILGYGVGKQHPFLDSMTEDRFKEFAQIMTALPQSTEFLFYNSAQAQTMQLWLEQHQTSQLTQRIDTNNHGVTITNAPGYNRWAQDIGEFVLIDEQLSLLSPWVDITDQSNRLVSEHIPLQLDGGDVTSTQRHVLVGFNSLERIREDFSGHFAAATDEKIQETLSAIFERPVLLFDYADKYPPLFLHVDQFAMPINDTTILRADYHFSESDILVLSNIIKEEVRLLQQENMTYGTKVPLDVYERTANNLISSAIQRLRITEAFLQDVKTTLTEADYSTVAVPLTAAELYRNHNPLNGILYRDQQGQHFIMPTFADAERADAMQKYFADQGLIVHPIADHFAPNGGNVHCISNIY